MRDEEVVVMPPSAVCRMILTMITIVTNVHPPAVVEATRVAAAMKAAVAVDMTKIADTNPPQEATTTTIITTGITLDHRPEEVPVTAEAVIGAVTPLGPGELHRAHHREDPVLPEAAAAATTNRPIRRSWEVETPIGGLAVEVQEGLNLHSRPFCQEVPIFLHLAAVVVGRLVHLVWATVVVAVASTVHLETDSITTSLAEAEAP